MSTPDSALRVLMVEDSLDDAELVERALRAARREIRTLRVDNADALREALTEFDPHVVLSDHSMPGFSGLEALRLVTELAPHIPLLFVSGTIGEEAAIEAVRHGAADYVFKENLRRLITAIDGALRKYQERDKRTRIERALRESEERFRTIVESTEDWVWEVERDGRLIYSNASGPAMLGYAAQHLHGRNVLELIEPSQRAEVEDALARHVAEAQGWNRWLRHWRRSDGSLRLIESTARPLFDEEGTVVGFRGIDRDVTLHLQQEEKIRQLARIHAVLSAIGNAILRAPDVTSLLAMACQLAVEQGQFKAAVIAMPKDGHDLLPVQSFGDQAVTDLVTALSLGASKRGYDHARPLVRAFHGGTVVTVPDYANSNLPLPLREGATRVGVAAQVALPIGSPPWAAMGLFCASPQPFDEEELALLQRMAADIDYAREFIAKTERLQYLAYCSAETGLPNRAAFEAELAARLASTSVIVGALDVMRSAPGSDARGRAFRDRLLERIGSCLRGHAPAGVYLAHVGGDDFMFACSVTASATSSLESIEVWLRECDAAPVTMDREQIHFKLRCGVAFAPEHGRDFEAIERAALAALAEAIGRDKRLSTYDAALDERATRRRLLVRELRTALVEQQFKLYLQPKFDARTRTLTGAEALLRWFHPQFGLISPGEFIPLLEETGLVILTGQWAMATAARILRSWRGRGRTGYRIAVNVSARELREQGFVDACRASFCTHADHGVDIEITESLLMEDVDLRVPMLKELRELGCRIAIDDFGTGYSSLNYLSRLPVDVLKIDQSFTAQIATSPETLALVTNIIGLAHSLNLEVVAEGVEDAEQEKLLRLLRCDQLQGYLLGRPVPVEEFERVHLAAAALAAGGPAAIAS